MPSQQDIQFGRLLIEQNLVTPDQVRECVALQAQHPQHPSIALILVERGYIDRQTAQQMYQRATTGAPQPPPADPEDGSVTAVMAAPDPALLATMVNNPVNTPPAPAFPEALEKPLGQLILQRQMVSQVALQKTYQECQVLRSQGQTVSLGQRLVQKGLLTPPALNELQNTVQNMANSSGSGSRVGPQLGSGVQPMMGAGPMGSGVNRAPPMGSGVMPSPMAPPPMSSGVMQSPMMPPPMSSGVMPGVMPPMNSGVMQSPMMPPPMASGVMPAMPSGVMPPMTPPMASGIMPSVPQSTVTSPNGSGSGNFLPPGVSPITVMNSKESQFSPNDPLARKIPPILEDGREVIKFGDYTVLEEVARGGMGIVYRAQRASDGKIVALKAMKAGEAASEKQVRRFKAETEAVTKLNHPHIVGIHKFGEFEGIHYYTMDLLEGGPLDVRIKRGDLPPVKEAVKIVQQVSEAIQFAHDQEIIHRDLKPANILFDTDGLAKVTDFGLAKDVKRKSMLTRTGAVVGTPYYMPPEQARGNTDIDARCDVYALGVILFELLTGKPPFRGETAMEIYQKILEDDAPPPSEKNKKVPPELDVICLKAMAKKRERRYQSAKELAADLQRFYKGEAIKARPPGLAEKLTEAFERNRRAFYIGFAVTAAVLITLVVVLVLASRSATHSRLVKAQRSWEKYREEVSVKVSKMQQVLKTLEGKKTNQNKAEVLKSVTAALEEYNSVAALIDNHKDQNQRSRLVIYLALLDPNMRQMLFEKGELRPKPEIDTFIEQAKKLTRFGIEEVELSKAEVEDYLAMAESGSIDPLAQGSQPSLYRIDGVVPSGDLKIIARNLWRLKAYLHSNGRKPEPEKALEAYEKSILFADQALEAKPARLELGALLESLGRADDALKLYNNMIEIDKNETDAALARGRIYKAKGELDKAMKDFAKVISRAFNPYQAHLERGRILLDQGQPSKALKDFAKAVEYKPDYYDGFVEWGRAFMTLEQYTPAQENFTSAIAQNTARPEAYAARAEMLLKQGKHDEAKKQWDSAKARQAEVGSATWKAYLDKVEKLISN